MSHFKAKIHQIQSRPFPARLSQMEFTPRGRLDGLFKLLIRSGTRLPKSGKSYQTTKQRA